MALDAILDTRFFFSFYNPEDEDIRVWTNRIVQSVSKGTSRFGVSVVTVFELYKVMGRIIGMDAVKIRVRSIKSAGIVLLPVSEEISERAGLLSLKYNVPMADALIAATAIEYAHGVVITDDKHFKKMDGVRVRWLGI